MKRCARPTRTARREPPLSFLRSVTRADATASVPFWIASGAAVDAAAGGADSGAPDSGASDTDGRGGGGGGVVVVLSLLAGRDEIRRVTAVGGCDKRGGGGGGWGSNAEAEMVGGVSFIVLY